MLTTSYEEFQKAGIAQLVERNLAKVEVASSNLVSRSNFILITYSIHLHLLNYSIIYNND